MDSKNKLWLYLFLFIGIFDLFFSAENSLQYRFFSKPLIIPVLLLYFYKNSKKWSGSSLRKTIITALIFSWIGDVLLLFPDLFLFGLGAFLMAHICYIIGFKLAQITPFSIGHVNFIRLFFFNLPIYLLAGLVYFLIQPNLAGLKTPVVIYLIVIVMMATTARERYNQTTSGSFWQVFLGGMFFLLSDAVLAIDLFFRQFPESNIIVMGTYIIAQFLIIQGILQHEPVNGQKQI
jgi:uncharacterized membrane protein YhhN